MDCLLLRIFTIFIFMIMNLFLLNIIVGIIIALTSVYIDNTKDE